MSQTEETADQIDDSSAPLIEHLAELRTRLIRCMIAFLIGIIICWFAAGPIYDFLAAPVCSALAERGQACELQYINLEEGFFVDINISMFAGFILMFPFIAHQLWRFVAPGLYKTEKNAFLPFLVASPFMFVLGAAFAYYVVTPLAYDFFLNFQKFGNEEAQEGDPESLRVVFEGSAQAYLSLTRKFIMAFGLCFQLPILLTLMGKAGLVSSRGLRQVRKYAMVGILVLAGLVTPPDVITQIILFAVVYGLYEISIHLVARVEAKRKAQMMADGTWDEELYGEGTFDDDEAPEDAK